MATLYRKYTRVTGISYHGYHLLNEMNTQVAASKARSSILRKKWSVYGHVKNMPKGAGWFKLWQDLKANILCDFFVAG